MKKKITKKSIDIESEFVGKPCSPKQPKEKKNDLTKDLLLFLEQPISMDSIKDILIRIEGRWIHCKSTDSKIKIYAFQKNHTIKTYEFVVLINAIKHFEFKYYLENGSLYKLCYFENIEKIDRSVLRQKVIHKINDWLIENINEIKIIN